jgi:predicted component of type VI protein secretion system
MQKPISFGKIDFEIVASMEEARGVPEAETPFCMLIMGDFSGRTNRGIFETADIAKRKPLLIDRSIDGRGSWCA